ncbi:hypothetical protein [Kineococcus gypseus]|uniref:hypothetical protein n=1 Tax=Kineococcus gypseus TaxID=1637102 RepID=UPI003D7E6A69
MTRRVLALDRLAALVAGLVLLALGLAAAAWGAGQLPRLWPAAPAELRLSTATDAYAQSWWPLASGAAGAVLVLLALWWLLAHLPRRGVPHLRLPGSDRTGALAVDGGSAVQAAAEEVAALPGVRSADGRLVHERGHLLAVLTVTADPTADLAELVDGVERVSGDLRRVLGRDDVRGRVRVQVARRARAAARAV